MPKYGKWKFLTFTKEDSPQPYFWPFKTTHVPLKKIEGPLVFSFTITPSDFNNDWFLKGTFFSFLISELLWQLSVIWTWDCFL